MKMMMGVKMGAVVALAAAMAGLGIAAGDAPPGVAVFTAGVGGYDCYRIPALLQVSRDLFLAFAEGRKFSCADHDWNDVVLRRSSDGVNWEGIEVVATNSTPSDHVTLGNPAPVIGENAWIHLLYCRNNLQVFHAVSKDGGESWSHKEITASVVPANWTWVATGPPGSLMLRDGPFKGRIVVPADHIAADGSTGSHTFYSDDQGKTWKLGGLLDRGNEAQAAALPSGQVVLSMRPQRSSAPNRLLAFSDDGGASFTNVTAPKDLPDPYCEGSIATNFAAPSALYLSNACSTTDRVNMCIHGSQDGGVTWTQSSVVWAGPSAYSSLLVDPFSPSSTHPTLHLLWEAGEKDYTEGIRFATIHA